MFFDFSNIAEVYNFERDALQLLVIVAEYVLVNSLAAVGNALSSDFTVTLAQQNVVRFDISMDISDRVELLHIGN